MRYAIVLVCGMIGMACGDVDIASVEPVDAGSDATAVACEFKDPALCDDAGSD